ncbi:universal stress protein [Desulfosarcina ovata subsp. sediminis]|uniref:Universal stress protein n=1 Tax=Desulfosarcina ovata subsp. sediminis TaxID=885957 RepID=A0A5K7ZW92_9BACT|nr:universal stress protein [Desulfosarcina ovata]BBO84381.1 universal stress protein [Desulfosarcina ovata subsp. sediminis]
MRFETLLFHTRFRELAFNSLKTVLQLKTAGLKKVVLAHVIPRDDVAFVPYGGTLKADIKRLREEARVTFDDWIQTIADPQLIFTQRIEIGAPNAKILEMAEAEKADMIVVGRKKRTLMEKVYVGTHVLDVLRRSTVPVLMSKYMVQYEWQGESLMRTNEQIWKRPLLASDWSDPSRRALDATLAMKPLVEKIGVAHVLGRRRTKNLEAAAVQRLEAESERRLRDYCQEIEAAGIQAEPHLAMGRTVEAILKMSRDYGATLIVMGRTGKDWFQEYWLGGVSHRVAELSELPVLLIP